MLSRTDQLYLGSFVSLFAAVAWDNGGLGLAVCFSCLRKWCHVKCEWKLWDLFFFPVDVRQIGTHKNIVQNEDFCKMGQLYRGWQVGLMLKQTPKNISSKLFLCILIRATHKCPMDPCSELGACAWQELCVMKNRFVVFILLQIVNGNSNTISLRM